MQSAYREQMEGQGMSLSVESTSLREVMGQPSKFPSALRQIICQALPNITDEQLASASTKHEAEAGNFDCLIEAALRQSGRSLTVKANHPVAPRTRFNCDLLIEASDAIVCLEVEKGDSARFELDILKMQAFGFHQRGRRPGMPCFGAFIVPCNNRVQRHISGNARESSYKYLRRLCRLVSEIGPTFLDDILIVGYEAHREPQKRSAARRKSAAGRAERELAAPPASDIEAALRGYAPEGRKLVLELRDRLRAEFPEIREKHNPRSRYLAFAVGRSDAAYIYLQKRRLLLDVRVPQTRAADLTRRGIRVAHRGNYQGKAGWLTGVLVPHDTDKVDLIADLLVEALRGS